MKYIDAEKLKTWLENEADMEFKKTEENANSPVLCHFHNGCRMQALDTIDFIDALQQEQPEVDLEEAVVRFVEQHKSEFHGYFDIRRVARHFYGLGLNARNTEYIRKDALMEWAKENYLNENASAIRKVCYKQLIDKLDSM